MLVRWVVVAAVVLVVAAVVAAAAVVTVLVSRPYLSQINVNAGCEL